VYRCRRHGGVRLCIPRLSRRNGGACIEGALPGHNRFDTIMQGAIALGPKTDGFGKDKAAILKRRRCLNPRPGDVADPNFVSDNPFFDARDLIQVKYEMLRRVERDGESVARTSAVFGLSRPSFYNAMRAFRSEGMEGLAAKPPGPRGPHKLNEELMAFVEQVLAENGSIRPSRLAALIRDAFGVSVHPRSIDRALRRKKKRDPHPSAETGPVQPG
jgi:transposase